MDTPLSTGDRVVVAVAAVLHLGIAVFPLAATGLLAPPWYVVASFVVWLAGAVVIWRAWRSTPRRVWLVPVAVIGLWVAGLTLGDLLLGWTA